jgi:hypothetical protein
MDKNKKTNKKRSFLYVSIYVFTLLIAISILIITLSTKKWEKEECELTKGIFSGKEWCVLYVEKISIKKIKLELCPVFYMLSSTPLPRDCWISTYSSSNEKYILDVSFTDKSLETDRYEAFYVLSIVLFSVLGISGIGGLVRYIMLIKSTT